MINRPFERTVLRLLTVLALLLIIAVVFLILTWPDDAVSGLSRLTRV